MADIRYIYGTDGPDNIANGSSNITLISSFGGDDTIVNSTGGILIDAGTDNNNLSLSAKGGVSIFAGGGDDTINFAEAKGNVYHSFISVSGGDNLINNSNIQQATIRSGEGNDTIISGGYYSSINAGDGNNSITISNNQGGNSIVAGSKNDFVNVAEGSYNNYIKIGAGNNTVEALGLYNSVIGGDGDSRVSIGSGYVKLGDGNGNEISLGASGGSSVISGSGDDTINFAEAKGNVYHSFISVSGGDNLINNSNIQ
ncbi:MAG: hypothetical protein II902_09490, partial [Selenomonadaceae bacterium]|nr:hypothetical protein [Selenomonadaceae bacterium]